MLGHRGVPADRYPGDGAPPAGARSSAAWAARFPGDEGGPTSRPTEPNSASRRSLCGDRCIAIDFADGLAWAPEGFDSAIVIEMFVTEQPVGGEGRTLGSWKQSQHFGS